MWKSGKVLPIANEKRLVSRSRGCYYPDTSAAGTPSERGWFITMVTDARNITFCNQHTQRSFKESVKIRALSTISENCQRARRLHSHNAAFRAAKWGGGGGARGDAPRLHQPIWLKANETLMFREGAEGPTHKHFCTDLLPVTWTKWEKGLIGHLWMIKLIKLTVSLF